jgi:hypothetical protein
MTDAVSSKNHTSQLQKELNDIVDLSPLPSVGIVDVDETSNGIRRALRIRTLESITGPYRALKLSPHYYSDGKLTIVAEARKMSETYSRIDSLGVQVLEDPEGHKDEYAELKAALDNQTKQTDGFKIVNLHLTDEDSELSVDGSWIQEYVKLVKESKSNLLFCVPPPNVQTADEVLRYQIAAMKTNVQSPNPLHVAGIVPPISPQESTRLIDSYLGAGINTIIYDFRGRRPNDSSLAHLAAIASASDTPPYIHGLHVSPNKKWRPYHSIQDLAMASFGIQSVSNLRRPPGGSGEVSEVNRRIKCVHRYYMPTIDQLQIHEFICPYCNTSSIESAIKEGVKADIRRTGIAHNVNVSYQEFENVRTKIKESCLKGYLKGKPGFSSMADALTGFEKAVMRVRSAR